MAKLLSVIGIAVGLAASPAAQTIEYIDPADGFTHVVTVSDRGVKTIYVSGQVGQGEAYQTHVESAFSRIVQRLQQAGATVNDVVKMRAFVKNLTPDLYGPIAEVRRRTFPEGSWPASTVAGVQALAADSMRVEVEVVAVVAEEGVDLSIQRFAPSNGFSGAVAVTAHGVTTVYVAGQVGQGEGLTPQTASVWGRIGQRLEEAGASYADLVKTNIYIVDLDPGSDLTAYRSGVPAVVSNLDQKPASTLLGVPSLANDRFLVEIDAVAVVGSEGESVEREFIEPGQGFTQAIAIQGSGPKTVYLSGQLGRLGDSFADQAAQAYANISRQLEAAGGSIADLLKATVYIPGYREEDRQVLGPVRDALGFGDGRAPASTLLGIQSLYSSEAAIEVEGVAVIGR